MNLEKMNIALATVYPDWIEAVMHAINKFRRTLWKEIIYENISTYYHKSSYDKPFIDYSIEMVAKSVKESFNMQNNVVQREYLLTYPKELIYEPKYGWAMTTQGELLLDSLPYTYYALFPGMADYVNSRFKTNKCIKTKTIASFRDVGDKNYYHFYNDHLVKLALFNKMGIDDNVPLLVSNVLYSKPYFQEALDRSGLRKRSWIVQDKEYILSQKSHFVKTMPVTREYIEYILRMLNPPKPNPNKHRKIFIDRRNNVGRCIANIGEVHDILSDLDFEIVYLEKLSLSEQMELFSEAGTVVGIHGAGLSNIIFRAGEPLNVIEIFPPNNIPAMFYWIACRFGFRYDALVGEKDNWRRAERQQYAKINFYLDPEKLKKKLIDIGY